jgi:alpha-D-ribose 1-methylphosphonate 5-triphosphate diphosphatase PhnM
LIHQENTKEMTLKEFVYLTQNHTDLHSTYLVSRSDHSPGKNKFF